MALKKIKPARFALIFLFLLFPCLVIHAQTMINKQDSMLLAEALNNVNEINDSLPFRQKQIIQFEETISAFNSIEKIEAYKLLGYKLKKLNKPQLAAMAYDRALSFADTNDNELRASIKSEKAQLLFDLLFKDEIIDLFNDALEEKPKKGGRLEAIILMNRGRAYYENGDYKSAMNDYLQSKQYFDRENVRDEQLGILLHFIGSVFKRQNNDAEALKWYEQIIELGREIKSKIIEAEGLYLSADIYNIMQDSIKDFQYSLAALNIYRDLKKYAMLEMMYMNISHYYMNADNWETAKMYLDSSYNISLLNNSEQNLSTLFRYYAKYHSATGNYKKAIEYIDLALEKAENSKSKKMMLLGDVHRTKAWIHYDFGNYKNAFESLDEYQYYWEKLINEQNSKIVHDLEARYQNEKKKKEIELLNKEKALSYLELKSSQQRNIFLAICFLLACIFIVMIINRYRFIKKQKNLIEKEKQRSDELLLNILPAEMAEELKDSGTTKAKAFTMVTVMFTDFKDFTTVSEKVSAELLVDEIHACFSAFDRIIQKYKIEKIKTIGDSYMCASGLPVSNYTHAMDMVNAALEFRDFMLERKKEKEANNEIPFELRIGIHTGPVVAGIVGIKKFAYDIWGDTVNLAARMEQNSAAGKINISGSTYELVKDKFKCIHRGKIEAKNKGQIEMYFLENIL